MTHAPDRMKITIIYDNTVFRKDLRADWGFSCLVEAHGRNILFDAGADGAILRYNMEKLNIDPAGIEDVFISHAHFDHTGGLAAFLNVHSTAVYIPASCPAPENGERVIRADGPLELHENIFSTGELGRIEQSLVIRTPSGLVVIAGCSHPGVGRILNAASAWGKVRALVGGLHGFRDLYLLKDIDLICPTHCTQFIPEIKSRFPAAYVSGGAGRVISD